MSTTSELVERLRGKIRVPITDGLGPAGGEEPDNANFFVRTFPTSPLAKKAADALDELERENARLREALIIYFTQPSSPRHDEAFNTLAIFATTRAALAGSGER